MSRLNKIITNFPVSLTSGEVEVLNLTLSAVITGDGVWRPTVAANGDISWTYDKDNERTPPGTQNIKGPIGPPPEIRINQADSHWQYKGSNGEWQDLGIESSGSVGPHGPQGIQGPAGPDGQPGAGLSARPGTPSQEHPYETPLEIWQEGGSEAQSVLWLPDGLTPDVVLQSFEHSDTDPANTDGGTRITFNYGEGSSKNRTFSAFNGAKGADGAGASYTPGRGIAFNDGAIEVNLLGPNFLFDAATSALRYNTDGTDDGGYFNTVEGHQTWTSGGSNHVEGMWTWAKGQGNHSENVGCSAIGYGVHAQGLWTCFVSDSGDGGDAWWNHGAGASVEGICNKTREIQYSGADETLGPVHGGILKVIGNGTRNHPDASIPATYDLSDAFIFYRDGTLWAAGDVNVDGKIHGYADSAEYAEYYYDSFSHGPKSIGDEINGLSSELGTKLDRDVWNDYSGTFFPQSVWDDVSGNFLQIVNVAGSVSGNGSNEVPIGLKMPFVVGVGNTVGDDGKCIAIGNRCNVSGNSCAVNDDNVAWNNSFAFGWSNSACLYSLAGGNKVSAYHHSVAVGHGENNENDKCIASNYSVALGDACEAYNYSQAFGRGVKFTGNANGKGGLAIGGWNKTQSDALFVVGNGTGNGNSRSDAMVVGIDGGVSATRFANMSGSDTVGSYQGINNVQVYQAGTSTSNLPDDGVLRIFLES